MDAYGYDQTDDTGRSFTSKMLSAADLRNLATAPPRSTPSKAEEVEQLGAARPPLAAVENTEVAARSGNPQAAALSLLDDFAEEASSRRIQAAVAQAKERMLGSRAAAGPSGADRVSIAWRPAAKPAEAKGAELSSVAASGGDLLGGLGAAGDADDRGTAEAPIHAAVRQQQELLNKKWGLERSLRTSAQSHQPSTAQHSPASAAPLAPFPSREAVPCLGIA